MTEAIRGFSITSQSWQSILSRDINKADQSLTRRNKHMANSKRLPAFEKFIEDMRFSWAELSDTEARMKKVQVLLEKLVNDPTMREHAKTWPSTEGHKNLLLYEDPDYNFVVNAVVRTPGRDGRIHDHAHAWTAYGVLDGTERLERYRRVDDGKRENYALLQLESLTEGYPGKVDLVPPFAIHSEKGGPARSVAVIVRSERLVGKTLQGRYDAKTDQFQQGQGPTQVPFEVA
jgi:predicted metal-dependent enzyme (double-stranded beta helix superfamily)